MVERYQQPALIEEYIGGREFTVGLLGERRPKVLPPMEIVFTDKSDKTPIYKFEDKLETNDRIATRCRRSSSPAQLERLERRRAAPSWRWAAATSPASTSAWTKRAASTSSSATRCRVDPRLERPGAHRPRRRHGLPNADRGDLERRHSPLQRARGLAADAIAADADAREEARRRASARASLDARIWGRFKPGKFNAITDVEGRAGRPLDDHRRACGPARGGQGPRAHRRHGDSPERRQHLHGPARRRRLRAQRCR